MSKVTGLRIKYNDGTYSEEIPIKVSIGNVEWDQSHTLEDIIGLLDISDGTIAQQLATIVSESKPALQNGTATSLVTTGEKYNWNNKTSNTGTVTDVTAGIGLSGGTVNVSGTIKANLNSEDSIGTIGTTNKLYAIGVDSNGKLCVSVPWTNTEYDAATAAPQMDGTSAVGTSMKYAREDHVHPSDTSKVSTSTTINGHALTGNIVLDAQDVLAIPAAQKGVANGVAELDENGRVPTSQLPSYVDDVMEYASMSYFPQIGESGKIYVSTATNLTYRWSGTTYVEISPSLALGETETTAYRGDRGKVAYEHATDENKIDTAQTSGLYKVAVTSEGHIAGVTAVQKSDITDLGIPAQDTTYESKTAVQNGTDVSLVTTGQKYNWNNKVDKETGKGLSTNDYTTTEKSKLAGIAEGAEANVQADWSVTDSASDAYIKNKPTIPVIDDALSSSSTNGLQNAVIYTELDKKVDKVTGKGLSTNDYTTTQKNKLAGIAEGAQVNVQSDWNETNENSSAYIANKPSIPIIDSTLSDSSTNGIQNAAVYNALQNKVNAENGKGLSTNDYTTAEKNKLANLNENAEANVQSDWNETDSTSDAFIKNKPIIPEGAVIDPELSSTSNNPVRNSTIYAALQGKVDTEAGKGLSSNDYTTTEKNKLAGIAEGAQPGTITGITMNGISQGTSGVVDLGTVLTSHQDITGKADKSNTVSSIDYDSTNKKITKTINGTTSDVVDVATLKTDLGSMPASDVAAWAKEDDKPSYTAAEVGAIPTIAKGAASGVAELDSTGKVPSSQLPSYVDDVVEYASSSSFPATGETGKIYIDTSSDVTYRWSGSGYVAIGSSLALGETSSTAYRGDRGKTAYDHATDVNKLTTAQTSGLYKMAVTSEGHVASVTAVQKSDITALGIPGEAASYSNLPAAQGGTDVSLVTTGQKYNWNNSVIGDEYLLADDAGSAADTNPINANQLGGHTASEFLTTSDVIDRLDSTSTTDALSAKQGKILYEEVSGKAGLASPRFTGAPSVASGTDYTTAKLRNVILSTVEPTDSDGSNGDIWIVYSE